MVDEKFFYKYQSLKVAIDDNGKILKDDNGNDIIYTIKNLANNQLYFSSPRQFNDPFDCKFNLEMKGTKEQWIDFYLESGVKLYQAEKKFNKEINDGNLIRKQDFYYNDLDKFARNKMELGKSLKRNSREMDSIIDIDRIRVCCFSDTSKNILMWSHYADNHQGICISIQSLKGDIKKDKRSEQFLTLYSPSSMKTVTSSRFWEVDYKDDLPESFNALDMSEFQYPTNKIFNYLLTKFSDWRYECEYRLILLKESCENQLLKYKKKNLEGVIFGLNISPKNAKLVHDTIKKNYLDEGVAVNFYEAKEVPRKYVVDIVPIDDIEKYIDNLRE